MLDFSVSQHPFRFGLAEGIEPHQVTPGTLLRAENAVWLKSGKVQKRSGTSLLATTGAASLARIFARGTELCATDGSSLYSYSTAAGAWRNAGSVNDVAATWATALDTMQGVSAADVVYVNGILFYAWATGDPWLSNASTDLWMQAVDAATNQILTGPVLVANGTTFGARILYDAVNNNVLIVTRINAAAPYALKLYTFSASTYAPLASTTLRSDVGINNGTGAWDAHLYGTTLVLGYNRTGSIIALESFTPTLAGSATASASGTVTDASGCTAISIHGTAGESLYVVYVQGTALPRAFRMAVNNPSTMAAVTAATTIDTPAAGGSGVSVGVTRYSATQCVCSVSTQDGTLALRLNTYVRTNAAVASLTNPTYHSVLATSRPFMIGTRAYISATLLAVGQAGAGSNSALLRADDYRHLGIVDLQVGGFTQTGAPTPSPTAISATQTALVAPFQASVALEPGNWRQGTRIVRVSTGASKPADMYRSGASGQEAFVSGCGLTSYDGSAPFDYGFASSPVLSTATSGVGGSIAAGTYLYSAVSEYRSRTGLFYRSPAAVTRTQATAGATSTNTVSIINCQVSNKPNANIGFLTEGVFRSTVGGAIPQRLSFEPRFNTVYTDKTIAIQTLSDTRADADIGLSTALATRPTLYTTGGILDDFQPPSNVTMTQHIDRLWVLAGDQMTWWYSKAFQDDTGTAPGFHPNFRIVFADVQTAMASMDDKAIFFSASGIKYMLGTGPAPNGLNSDFQTPTTIQSDVGCTNPRSVVTTPDGVMFLSDRGIYLLDRGLTLSWIGRPVKDTLAAYPVVTSAVLVAKQNQVRFTCTDAAASVGITIVYDYVEKQWSTFKHWVNGIYGGPIADACMWNGAWTFVIAAGLVYVESTTTYLDAESYYVPMTLETAWITAPSSQASPSAGPLKFQSVRTFGLHGFSNSDHDLTVDVGFDTEAAYAQTATFLAGTPTTTIGTLEDCEVSIGTRRKCNAIRFRVSDASPTGGFSVGTGQGPSFDMMALEVGVKRGTGNTPATKRR